MKIYYDYKTKAWVQTNSHTGYVFGKNHYPVKFVQDILPHYLAVSVAEQANKVGPLVGILTCKKSVQTAFTGNIALFKRIQKGLATTHGGLSVVFTPNDFTTDHLNGFVYHEINKEWIGVQTPLPDVIYNRIPSRAIEQTEQFHACKFIIKEQQIPFFNEGFFTKWEIYQILNTHPFLKPFLPETHLLTEYNVLDELLKKYQKIYIKPIDGHQGEGIGLLEQENNQMLRFTTITETSTFFSLTNFWQTFFLKKSRSPYIAQQAISADTYKSSRYDLRVFAHFQKGKHVISGIGVRQAKKQPITTHVPNGGEILPFSAIEKRVNQHILIKIIERCGKILTQHYGLIGEFSVDMGISKEGRYFLYEINSKPMVFDEEDIKKKGMENLALLFYEWSKFNLPQKMKLENGSLMKMPQLSQNSDKGV